MNIIHAHVWFCFAPKHLQMYGLLLCTEATDAPMLRNQAITIHSADQIFFVLDQFHSKWCIYDEQHDIMFGKNHVFVYGL